MPVTHALHTTFYCDKNRHLVCKPYSVDNLHRMAVWLGINKSWFHKNHYDIPYRKQDEIMKKCKIVNSRTIVKIIKGIKFK